MRASSVKACRGTKAPRSKEGTVGMNSQTSGQSKTKWKKRLIPAQWLASSSPSVSGLGWAMNGRGC